MGGRFPALPGVSGRAAEFGFSAARHPLRLFAHPGVLVDDDLLPGSGMRINTVEPGYTAPDLNKNTCIEALAAGAEIIVCMAPTDLWLLRRRRSPPFETTEPFQRRPPVKVMKNFLRSIVY